MTDPFGTITTIDTTSLVSCDQPDLLDLHWRMLKLDEIRRGMGFADDLISWSPSQAQVVGLQRGRASPGPMGRRTAQSDPHVTGDASFVVWLGPETADQVITGAISRLE